MNNDWHETTKHERNRKIFKEELDDFLPEKILDFHVHVWNEGVIPAGEFFSCAGQAMTKYDLDDLGQDLRDLYPGRETSAVCFGSPNENYDRAANDRYVARACDGKRFIPFRLFDPNEKDPEAIRRDLVQSKFRGIKPYLNYVRGKPVNDIEIDDMLPGWIMEIVNELKLMVVLHIPRQERLADPLNQEQLIRLCRNYPDARIILAHVGRAYYLRNILDKLNNLKKIPNLWYDLAMLNNEEVLEYLFRTVPLEKVLYATDLPISVAPGKSVEINNQYTYVTPVPWKLSISDDHKKLVFTSFLYEELRAIQKAARRVGSTRADVEGIFYGNGMKLLKNIE